MDSFIVENEIIDISGDSENIKIILTPFPIDINDCIEWAKHPSAGAISTFIGTTRDNFDGQEVISLDYSCYPAMALSETRKLCLEAIKKFSFKAPHSKCCKDNIPTPESVKPLDNDVKRVLVAHRLGAVAISEVSILIAISTPHRESGLEACKFLIDSIKKTVPIWKKELLKDGSNLWK